MGRKVERAIVVPSSPSFISSGVAANSLATSRNSSAVSGRGGRRVTKRRRIGNCPAVKTSQAPIECRDLRCSFSLRRPVERRGTEPDHRLGRFRDQLLTAQGSEARDRWQHSDRVFANEPIKETRSLLPGSLVISACGGGLVNAPSRTNDNRFFASFEVMTRSIG
jgi:hypothetical protein